MKKKNETKMTSNRIAYMDIAKGIGILLVVLGHTGNHPIERFVNLFHMSLFVFASGYFWKDSNIYNKKKWALRRLKSLYLPYLFCELFFYLLRPVFCGIGWYSSEYAILSLKDSLIYFVKIILGMGREPIIGSFWFVITLIFINIEMFCITWLVKRVFRESEKIRALIIFILFCFACVMVQAQVVIPRFMPSILVLPFYYIGFIVKEKNIDIRDKMNKNKFYDIFSITMVCAFLAVLNIFGSISVGDSKITDPAFFIAAGICGIYLITIISILLEKSKIGNALRWFGKNSIWILILHEIGFKVIDTLLVTMGVNSINLSNIPVGISSGFWFLVYFASSLVLSVSIISVKEYIEKKIKIRN